ncbi:hypothetical protein L486_03576 [Kwoniella mangroviensis CBS 10435]|uniref:Uncharacterized protein n=1 Tax=Kwoniella mangroviensis CBS 10435 TaxID=1331196 RepID=A0A1B9IU88_9TREE|nr:uncharacterized protein I203_02264 [Kwoniella mangroviensis CBS 8507]OCF59077.1 hypothetical protein L486_03576 [Kwoniella mangroviensis CBS 10435]OCF68872.1 hypothetical protein I203_02264 [Kwoniella mangroviensis CBS 8507]OCF76666.1 hypothetical protein I204_02366 [Kwoniella mangroviensis CBS 8886]
MAFPSSSSLPFGLSTLFKPLSPSLARTRLKSNLFILFLFQLIKGYFSPYITIRSIIIKLSDGYLQGRKGREESWGENGIYVIEFLISSILVWNIIESTISIQYPQEYIPPIRQNLVLTPSKVSSPLTRSYSPASSSTPSSSSQSQSQSQRSLYPSTPTRNQLTSSTSSNLNQSQSKPHPLSNSTSKTTAQIFNLPYDNSSPSKSGLFFEKKDSPPNTKTQGAGGGVGGDFVLVDREEKDWVDNVLKGVRGKGGKVGL